MGGEGETDRQREGERERKKKREREREKERENVIVTLQTFLCSLWQRIPRLGELRYPSDRYQSHKNVQGVQRIDKSENSLFFPEYQQAPVLCADTSAAVQLAKHRLS